MSLLRRRSGGPALVAVLLLLVTACGGQTPTPSSGTPSPSLARTPTPSATPVPSASPDSSGGAGDAALYEEIEAQVIALRGIEPTKPVERAVLDEAGLREFITQSFNKDNPAELVAGFETLYKSLLLMPQSDSLEDLYIEMLTSQVAGFYDDETKKMYVVSRSGDIGPTERVTYAHEYTHALQDQAYGIRSLVGEAKDQGDRNLAALALVEGDATLLMSLWAQQHLTPAELAEVATSTDPASEAVLAKMPAILKDSLMFPYLSGLTLALGDFASGGFAAVDERYQAPPASTEQVIHTDKLAAGEAPISVAFPEDLAKRLGTGWEVSLQDTFGEFGLELLLRDAGGVPSPQSRDAAAGWGGDRVALVEGPSGATGVVMDAAWDTKADAQEYAAALESVAGKLNAAGRSARVLVPSADRVVLVTGETADTVSRLANALELAG